MKKIFSTVVISTAVLVFSTNAFSATTELKATYNAAVDSAKAEYKLARAKCDTLTGNPKDVCVEEAKASRTHTEAEAKAQYKNTVGARTDARKAIASADYDVAKAKCGALAGNEKDICLKEAKSAKIAATSDANADKKVVEARTDARSDKHTAEYKVAIEKCDALAGAAKDTCVADAKAKFGK
ncbi:MAG: hypothetical protein V4805_19370 [Pseudomonadota bacterium]